MELKTKAVIFLKNFPPYAKNDVAGFKEGMAKKLIEAGFAEEYKTTKN